MIGYNLVQSIEDNMQIDLYNQLYKSTEIVASLSEPEEIAMRRKALVDQIRVMRNAQKVLRKDPDLMSVMSINMDDSDITKGAKNKVEKKKDVPVKEKKQFKIGSK